MPGSSCKEDKNVGYLRPVLQSSLTKPTDMTHGYAHNWTHRYWLKYIQNNTEYGSFRDWSPTE